MGVSEAIDLAMRALVSPGDEVLYHEPCFVSYPAAIRLAHGVPVAVETRAENGFRLDMRDLEAKTTPRTKALLLNFPCNPTGATIGREAMAEILAFCEKHDLVLLSDEVYSELDYSIEDGSDAPLASFAGFPEYRDRVVLLNGFSKSWAMTGYRLGYACGPEDVIDAMMKIHQYAIMSAPTLAQAAGVEAMDRGDADVAKMRREYRRRRDFMVDRLNGMGLAVKKPDGAFYLFVKALEPDAYRFFERAKAHELLVVPCDDFGVKGYVRIAYCTEKKTVENALPAFKALAEEYGL